MALPVRVFHVSFKQDQQMHKQAVKDLCHECYAKGAVGMGMFADAVPPCPQIVFFSMPEIDIAIESLFNSFANRTADHRHLGEWLHNVLNEDSRFKATAEGTWSEITDLARSRRGIWRDKMWGWYTLIDVTDADFVLEKKFFFQGIWSDERADATLGLCSPKKQTLIVG